jgi:hypothetical protein
MRSNGGPALRPNGFVLVSSRRLKPAAFSRAINEQRRRLARRKRDERTRKVPPSFGSVLINSCAIERHVPQTLLSVQIGKGIAALLGPTMNCAAASSKRPFWCFAYHFGYRSPHLGLRRSFRPVPHRATNKMPSRAVTSPHRMNRPPMPNSGSLVAGRTSSVASIRPAGEGPYCVSLAALFTTATLPSPISSGMYKSYDLRQPARRGSPSGAPIPFPRELRPWRALLAPSAPSLGFRRQCVAGLAHLLVLASGR